jgi:serine O-acetyltransferase
MFWTLRQQSQSAPPVLRQLATVGFRILERVNGCYIPASVVFAGTPCFPHGFSGVFIAGAARIGVDCIIYQHVTIGSNTLIDSSTFGAPTIGDRCYIGAGAKIIGGITIGNDVRIGANAVVMRHVPSNATIIAGRRDPVLSEPPKDNRLFRSTPAGWMFYQSGKWQPADDADNEAIARAHERWRQEKSLLPGSVQPGSP